MTDIVQARLLATAILLRQEQDLTESKRAVLMSAWESTSFRIYGLARRDARTLVGDYVRLAWRTITDRISFDEIFNGILSIAKQHPVDRSVEQVKSESWYPHYAEDVRYFLARYEEHLVASEDGRPFDSEHWNHIWKESPSASIEHILPQSSPPPEGIPDKDKEEYLRSLHSIGNLLLLPPKLNSQLGGKSPAEKSKAYKKTGLLIAREVVPSLMKWNVESIKERENKLLSWASQEWSDPTMPKAK